MVKRHNKTGRRQILQLKESKTDSGNCGTSALLATEKRSSATVPLDSQVADFLKEIDAMTVTKECLEAESLKDIDANVTKDNLQEICTDEAQTSLKDDGVQCKWKEIRDDSTGYNYYWNMYSNEVTWDCPPEYIDYVNAVTEKKHSTSQILKEKPLKTKDSHKRKKQKEAQPLVEGAIIPISYFGSSSSSEVSSDDNEDDILILKKHKPNAAQCADKCVDSSSSETRDIANKELFSEIIGPQLPPDYQFPEAVPVLSNSELSTAKCLQPEKGVNLLLKVEPHLPGPDYIAQKTTEIKSSDTCKITDISVDQISSNYDTPLVNKSLPIDLSTHQLSWEESLQSIEKQFKDSSNVNVEQFENSPINQKNLIKSSALSPPHAITSSYGCRSVVEYGSYTDDEDENDEDLVVQSESVSREENKHEIIFKNSSNQETKCEIEVILEPKCIEPTLGSLVSQKKEPFSTSTLHGKCEPINSVNQPSTSCSNDDFNSKSDAFDIDSLFSSHIFSGKFGLGFSRERQREIENDSSCVRIDKSKGFYESTNSYPSINFVKSNNVLDLKITNSDPIFKIHQVKDKKKTNGDLESDLVISELDAEDNTSTLVNENTSASASPVLQFKTDNDTLLEVIPPVLVSKNSKNEDKIVVSEQNDQVLLLNERIDESCRALEKEKTSLCNTSTQLTSSNIHLDEERETLQSQSNSSDKNITTDSEQPSVVSSTLLDTITDLSSLLGDKLALLCSNHNTLSSMTSYLIQLQTRLVDWKEGALEGQYFLSRLQEINQYLQYYERNLVSGDWTCHWDREHKRYFYMNGRTQHSQWTFPEELCVHEKTLWVNSSEVASSTSHNFHMARAQYPLTPFVAKQLHKTESVVPQYESAPDQRISQSSPPPLPPGVDSPPPPQTPLPETPPPPPDDDMEVEEGEICQDMDLENSNSSNSTCFSQNMCASESSITTSAFISSGSSKICNSPQHLTTVPEVPLGLIKPLTCMPVGTAEIQSDLGIEAELEIITPSASNSTKITSDKYDDMNINSTSRETLHGELPSTTNTSVTTAKKEKKKATKLTAGLALKKDMQTLVQKWQRIKKEQEKEDKCSD